MKIIILTLSILAITFISFASYILIIYFNTTLDTNKLINQNNIITIYNKDDKEVAKLSNKSEFTPINEINDYTKKAFISIEDSRFNSHHGIDYKGMVRALLNNIKSFSLKEGASTITQQLIKNTHLSNEKTLNRKIKEMILAKKIEKIYTKDQILESYLNTIYFGHNNYGISSASKFYFNKKVSELSINESAILASIIKAPTTYSPMNNEEKCFNRKNIVLKKMFDNKYISQQEYENNINKKINIYTNNSKQYTYFDLVKNELSKIIDKNLVYKKNIKIYTNLDEKKQKILEKKLNIETDGIDKTAVIMNNNAEIISFYSTCSLQNRQLGSTIKPILCYAPCIEENIISTATLINDEKTNFGNYSPSNFNEKYYGYITAKKALSISSNVCSIKVLNSIGIENAKKYLYKTNLNLTNNDNNLNIALGNTERGANLINLVGNYCIFTNKGFYKQPTTIRKIEFSNEITQNNIKETSKIFGEDTCFLINDMLTETIKTGTLKKLNSLNLTLAGKTGTVGNEKGNSDAYSISYSPNTLIGVWLGTKEGLMNNNITGGGLPTIIARNVWQNIETKNEEFKIPNTIEKVEIDKIALEDENRILKADILSPNIYKETFYFKKNNCPCEISTRYSKPILNFIKTSYSNKCFTIYLCQTENINYEIIKEVNEKEKCIYNSNDKNNNIIKDYNIENGKIYKYYIIPYYEFEGKRYYGDKQELAQIKTPTNNVGEWWADN